MKVLTETRLLLQEFTSDQIADFRLYRTFKLTQSFLKELIQDLEKITKGQYQLKTPQEINQNIRGHLFVQIDSVFTSNSSINLNIFLHSIVSLFNYIRDYILKNVKYYYQMINLSSMCYLIDSKVALMECYKEIIWFMQRLINKDERYKNLSNVTMQGGSTKSIQSFILSATQPLSKMIQILQVLPLNIIGLQVQLIFCSYHYKKQGREQVIKLIQKYVYTKIRWQQQAALIEKLCKKLMDIFKDDKGIERRYLFWVIELIKFGNFEKKLKGIQILKDLVSVSYQNKKFYSKFQQKSITLTLTKNDIQKQLVNNNIIQVLLENANPQILKRSLPILKFLSTNLKEQHFMKLLSLIQSAYQSDKQNIYKLIGELMQNTCVQILDKIWNEIISYKMDIYMIDFIKEFIINSYSVYHYYNNNKPKSYIKHYFSLLSINMPQKFLQKIIQNLKSLLNKPFFKNQKDELIKMAIQILDDTQMAPQMFKFLSTLNTYIKSDSENIIIQSFIKSLTQLKNKNNPQLLQWHIDFINQCGVYMKTFMSLNNLANIWQIHKKGWISNVLNKRPLDVSKQIFENLFQNSNLTPLQYIQVQIYNQIEKLFISINKGSAFQINKKDTLRIIDFNKIIGIQFFWKIACHTKNQVRKIATKKLVQIYSRPKAVSNKKQENSMRWKLWVKFTQRLFKQITKNGNLAYILTKFIKQCKGRLFSKKFFNKSEVTLKVGQKNGRQIKQITLQIGSSLFRLRKQINQRFRLNDVDFEMYTGQQEKKLSLQQQQDYSLSIIHKLSPLDIYFVKLKNKHILKETLDKLYAYLQQKYYNDLLIILQSIPSNYFSQYWNLLLEIPIDTKLKNKIRKCDFVEIPKVFGMTLMRLGFSLLIIKEYYRDEKWFKQFVNKGGYSYLEGVFMKIQMQRLIQIQNQICIRLLCEILGNGQISLNLFQYTINILLELLRDQKYDKITLHIIKILSKKINHLKVLELWKLFINFANRIKYGYQEMEGYLQRMGNSVSDYFHYLQQIKPNVNYCKLWIFFKKKIPNINIQKNIQKFTNWLNSQQSWLSEGVCNILNFLVQNGYKITVDLTQFLFPIQPSDKTFVNKQLRNAAYTLLQNTLKQSDIKSILLYLEQLLKCEWRRQGLWELKDEQKRNKYVGLKNQGATCYMNSLLQQLFMIKQFLQEFQQLDSLSLGQPSLLYNVQQVFYMLENSPKPFHDTKHLCQVIKDQNNQVVDIRVQMDVNQFFMQIVDKIEIQNKKLSKPIVFNKWFEGKIVNQLICQGHTSQNFEPFLVLQVQIKNKKKLQQGLDSFIQGQVLDGQNAFYCQRCQKKKRTIKRACIKELPQKLIICLKRFQFDYQKMIKIKVNDYCQFPQQLNMHPYTKEYLEAEGQIQISNDPYYNYVLRGVIIHFGTADVGHYYSYIKNQDGNWYQFNDEFIRQFDFKDMQNQAFGGVYQDMHASFRSMSVKQKMNNGYLLFYERKILDNRQKANDKVIENITMKSFKQKMDKMKKQKLILQTIFDLNFIQFFSKINKRYIGQNVFKSSLFLFFMGLIRAKDKNLSIEYFKTLKKVFKTTVFFCDQKRQILVNISEWFFENATYNNILEFTVQPFKKNNRYLACQIIIYLFKTLQNRKLKDEFLYCCYYIMGVIKKVEQISAFYRMVHQLFNHNQQTIEIMKRHKLNQILLLSIQNQRFTMNDAPLTRKKSIFNNFHSPLKQNYQPLSILLQLYQKVLPQQDIPKIIKPDKFRNFIAAAYTKRARKALAKMLARIPNWEQVINLIAKQMTDCSQMELKIYLVVLGYLVQIVDENQRRKVQSVVSLLFKVLKIGSDNFLATDMIVSQILKLGYKVGLVKQKIKSQKLLIKFIKQWIGQIENIKRNLREKRIKFFRKKPTYINTLQAIQASPYLSIHKQYLNTILTNLLEKNTPNLEYDSEDEFGKQVKPKQKVDYWDIQWQCAVVTDTVGVLHQIEYEGRKQWVRYDEQSLNKSGMLSTLKNGYIDWLREYE